MAKKFTLIDLFAGAGGLTWGFYKNNFNIKYTVEFWQPAVDTYNKNFKLDVTTKDITDQNVIDEIETNWQNKIDLVIGGFPCQGYSMAGKRNPDDPRNQLYKYTIKVIEKVKPKYFVLENVKGILSFKEKDGSLVIDKIIEILREKGYYSKFILLDATNFGVPQKRERVIFIGSSFENKEKVDQIIEKLSNFKTDKPKTVREAIEDLENVKELELFNHIFSKHSNEMIAKIQNTPQGKSVMKKYSDAYFRLDYDKPSRTVKENHGGVHVHPKLNRVLTPRELARLQSFPDDFEFLSSKSNVLKQIGNAVPPLMSFEIAKIVKRILKNE
ncbi:DNA cytosine methyltransferase [Mycoplasmopsis gallinacea]|uniref:Cytosine-specific methyltransferase n=1 Tax=Mycoplasmopsis gallinacea TaxID=29556 RepID=A0A6H0V2C2_9BACT|nr:DNA cytosine methyltransferase [Mycoplasmopsis gallinacea]QIW62481.1 DNA (cytosine-5-)-methyltransferase [Mycoplasmopsis gallinacea]